MKYAPLLLALAACGSALAAPLPDYPVVYSPETGGPVPNPAYHARSAQAPAASQAPQGTQMQAPTPPQELAHQGRYTLNANVGYAFKATPDSSFACDMATFEIEGAYYLVPHHAITISMGYAGGGSTRDFWVQDGRYHAPYTDSYDRDSYTVMAGYRYSRMVGRYAILQVGAKAGLDVQSINVDRGYGWHSYPYGTVNGQDGTAAGMAYAGYANVGFFLSESTCVHIGYQFRGSTAKPSANSIWPDEPKYYTHSMRWHEVRVGFTVQF